MNKHASKASKMHFKPQSDATNENETEPKDMTNLQDEAEKKSGISSKNDKMSGDPNDLAQDEKSVEQSENEENTAQDDADGDIRSKDEVTQKQSWEEKYATLNDSYLRLNAEFDNFRKRTIREKADLIKTGGASALTNLLPVIDDFERAMDTLQTTEDLASAVKGVNLIYEKFINYLSQQGVKMIDAIGQPFDTDNFEAVATFPVPEEDRKGKVIDCIQTGYKLFDKVLRHAKVVVGE